MDTRRRAELDPGPPVPGRRRRLHQPLRGRRVPRRRLRPRPSTDDEILQNFAAGPTLSSPGGPLNEKPNGLGGARRHGPATATPSTSREPPRRQPSPHQHSSPPRGVVRSACPSWTPAGSAPRSLVPGPGSYPLSLSATDGELRASDGMNAHGAPARALGHPTSTSCSWRAPARRPMCRRRTGLNYL